MCLLVRGAFTVIAASVQRDVDGVPQGAPCVRWRWFDIGHGSGPFGRLEPLNGLVHLWTGGRANTHRTIATVLRQQLSMRRSRAGPVLLTARGPAAYQATPRPRRW